MGFWSTLLKYGGKAAKGVGTAAAERSRNILVIVLTPVVLETPLSPETRMSMN